LILDIFLIALERVSYHPVQKREPKRWLNVNLGIIDGSEIWNLSSVFAYEQIGTNAARF
jgi:hypothetical protein